MMFVNYNSAYKSWQIKDYFIFIKKINALYRLKFKGKVVWFDGKRSIVGGDDKMKNVSDSSLHWGMVSII